MIASSLPIPLKQSCSKPARPIGGVVYPDETVHHTVLRMLKHHRGRMPVVSHQEKIPGYLGRTAVLEVRMRRFQDDRVCPPGWLKSKGARPAPHSTFDVGLKR